MRSAAAVEHGVQEQRLLCSSCGSPYEIEDRFCGECGTEMAKSEPSPPAKSSQKRRKRQPTKKPPKQQRAPPVTESVPPPATAEPRKSSRFWPRTTWGRALYVIVILGVGVLPLFEDDDLAAFGLLLALGCYLILTAWRSLLLAFGFLSGEA